MDKAEMMERMRINIPALKEWQDAIKIIDVPEPGRVHYTVDVPESLANFHGATHGGTAASICDTGAGFAMYSYGDNNVSSSASIEYVRAEPVGKLDVWTEPIHKGRSTAVIRVSARSAATGKLLFEGTHNMFILGRFEGFDE